MVFAGCAAFLCNKARLTASMPADWLWILIDSRSASVKTLSVLAEMTGVVVGNWGSPEVGKDLRGIMVPQNPTGWNVVESHFGLRGHSYYLCKLSAKIIVVLGKEGTTFYCLLRVPAHTRVRGDRMGVIEAIPAPGKQRRYVEGYVNTIRSPGNAPDLYRLNSSTKVVDKWVLTKRGDPPGDPASPRPSTSTSTINDNKVITTTTFNFHRSKV